MLEETKARFSKLYAEKKDAIEWMISFGNDFEKMEARIIKQAALGN